jgi:glycosyltransferase involved in cell wall biosynthesis
VRICSPQLGIDPRLHLGGAVYDHHLLWALADLGAEVHVLLPNADNSITHPAWRVTRTPTHVRSYYEYNWIFARALRRCWSVQPADLIRVHTPYAVGPGMLASRRRFGVPVVVHVHHVEGRPLWSLVDRLTLHRYDHIVTVSEFTRDNLVKRYGLDPHCISTVYQGIDSRYVPGDRDARLRQDWGDDFVAMHTGGLIERKNLPTTMQMTKLVVDRGLPFRLILIGDGPLLPALRAQTEALGIASRVEFWGAVDDDTKLKALRTADAYLHPSRLEGFGIAPAEAMACGLPVVAFDRGPIREIVRDGTTGVLVTPPDSTEAMAQAIWDLASHPDRRREMGAAAARDVRERFSWQRCAEQTLAVYRSVVGA